MASSRKEGTNEYISTYGNATRNYTSLATWEADTDVDLVTFGLSEILECYDDAASFNDYVTLDGATTDSSYFRIIRPAAGQGHDGTPNNGVTFIPTADVYGFIINEANSQIQDIICKLNINSANARVCFGSTAIGGGVFVGDIAFDSTNAGIGQAHGFGLGNIGNVKFINCLAHNSKNRGFSTSIVAGGNSYFYNCIATNNGGFGFANYQTANTIYFKNCLSSGNVSSDFYNNDGGAMNINYCASSDATADDWGGTGNRINKTFTFVNSGGDDFHLASTDAGARNYGTDLSADATYPFNDDINDGTMGAGKAGQTRPGERAWDIGFDEYVEPMPDRWHPSIEQPYSEKIEVIGY